MGMTKRISELICQSLSTQNKSCCFSIVRFGNVIGSSGSVIPKFENQILKVDLLLLHIKKSQDIL